LKPVSHGMVEWESTGGWRRDGEWYVRRGGDFFLYPITPTAGDLRFTANLRRGRRFQWVLNYVDAKNYLLFQIDKNNFVWYKIVDGERTKLRETPHGLDTKDACQLQITLVPGKIVHHAYDNGTWHPLDEWNDIQKVSVVGSSVSTFRAGMNWRSPALSSWPANKLQQVRKSLDWPISGRFRSIRYGRVIDNLNKVLIRVSKVEGSCSITVSFWLPFEADTVSADLGGPLINVFRVSHHEPQMIELLD